MVLYMCRNRYILIFFFRTAFLAFCNHSESRRLFVYLIPEESSEYTTEWVGQIRVSAMPPRQLSDKALIFLKCSHASRLHWESMGFDVVYSECSSLPLREFQHKKIVLGCTYLMFSHP